MGRWYAACTAASFVWALSRRSVMTTGVIGTSKAAVVEDTGEFGAEVAAMDDAVDEAVLQ